MYALYSQNHILHKCDCRRIKTEALYVFNDISEAVIAREEDNIRIAGVCKCCKALFESASACYHRSKRIESFCELVYKYALEAGISYSCNDKGDIVLKTQFETWIVEIEDVVSNNYTANICLYHKNNINYNHSNKCGDTLYPDFHVQYRKTQTVGALLLYVLGHEKDRWNVSNDEKTELVHKLLSTVEK